MPPPLADFLDPNSHVSGTWIGFWLVNDTLLPFCRGSVLFIKSVERIHVYNIPPPHPPSSHSIHRPVLGFSFPLVCRWIPLARSWPFPCNFSHPSFLVFEFPSHPPILLLRVSTVFSRRVWFFIFMSYLFPPLAILPSPCLPFLRRFRGWLVASPFSLLPLFHLCNTCPPPNGHFRRFLFSSRLALPFPTPFSFFVPVSVTFPPSSFGALRSMHSKGCESGFFLLVVRICFRDFFLLFPGFPPTRAPRGKVLRLSLDVAHGQFPFLGVFYGLQASYEK